MKYILFICLCASSFSFGKTPFQISDLYRVKTPGNLAVSPVDANLLLFTESTSQLKEGKSQTQIYLLENPTGETRRLTSSGSINTSPFWAPDGESFYFLSNRVDGMQLWHMGLQGGDPQQVSHFETGIENPKILPDGNGIIFVSTVFPECMEDGECNEKMADQLADGPVQAHLADTLLYRHWTSYRDFQYSHLFRLNVETGQITALTHGTIDFPAYGGDYSISPDGKELAVTGKIVEDPEISTNTDLYLIDLTQTKSEPMRITANNPAYDGDPVYSPNGSFIAYRRQTRPMFESDLFELMIYNRKTGKSQKTTVPFDNWIDHPTWSLDSQSIFVTAHEKGYFPIYQVEVATKKMSPFASGISAHSIAVSGKGLYSIQSSVGTPREIFFQPFSGKKQARLSDLNRALNDEVDIRPAESLWVKGTDGRKLHVFIVKPHDFDPDKKYPLILNVHGGPQYQWADVFRGDWQVYPGSGYIVAFPNPHGSSGYGQSFTDAISGDYGGKVMQDISAITDQLADIEWVDQDRMGAMGWSWGGYAMMWLEGHSNRFKALSSMMGIYDLQSMYTATEELWFVHWDNKGAPWENESYYQKTSPSSYVTHFKTPCLVITGEKDYRVPYTQSLQFFTALQRKKVPSRLIVFKNDGHWPHPVKSMPVYYNAHLEWFHKYLGGSEAPYNTEKMIRNQHFSENPQ